jgi:hypothetical protein
MDQVQVNIEKRQAVRGRRHDVLVPDFLEQGVLFRHDPRCILSIKETEGAVRDLSRAGAWSVWDRVRDPVPHSEYPEHEIMMISHD